MDSCKCLLNMLVSSRYPFRIIWMFILHRLTLVVPSLSHFLKLAQSSRSCTLFRGRPRAYLLEYLGCWLFDLKDMSVTKTTPSC